METVYFCQVFKERKWIGNISYKNGFFEFGQARAPDESEFLTRFESLLLALFEPSLFTDSPFHQNAISSTYRFTYRGLL
jgi:hypothetical protein